MTPISHPVHRPGQRRRASGKRTGVCTAALSLVLALGLVLGPGTLPSPAQVRTETGQDKAVRDGTAPARQQILRGSVDVRASLRNDAAELSLRHSDSPHDAALDREVFRPEDVCLGVPDRARRERTGPLMSSETEFLGTEGEKFYELPQEPDQDLVSLILDTTDVDYSELSQEGGHFSLVPVSMPQGSRFGVHTQQENNPPNVLVDSTRGKWSIASTGPSRTPVRWAFTEPGTYAFDLQFTAETPRGGKLTSGKHRLTFAVGDQAINACATSHAEKQSPAPSGPGATPPSRPSAHPSATAPRAESPTAAPDSVRSSPASDAPASDSPSSGSQSSSSSAPSSSTPSSAPNSPALGGPAPVAMPATTPSKVSPSPSAPPPASGTGHGGAPGDGSNHNHEIVGPQPAAMTEPTPLPTGISPVAQGPVRGSDGSSRAEPSPRAAPRPQTAAHQAVVPRAAAVCAAMLGLTLAGCALYRRRLSATGASEE